MKTDIELVQSGSWAGLSGHFYKGKNKVSRHATLIAVWCGRSIDGYMILIPPPPVSTAYQTKMISEKTKLLIPEIQSL